MKVKLCEAFDLQMGKTPSRNELSSWNGNHKWISISDLTQADKYIVDTKECISDEGIIKSGIKLVPKNTVVMSFKLTIGKAAITAEDMYTNEAIMAFIDKRKYQIDPNYLYYLFTGMDWSEGTNKAVMGLTLNKATLSQKEISIPSIEQQMRIITVLDKISDLIALRKQQLAKLDELVIARFVEMFGDPVINPYGFKTASLSQIAEYYNGLTYKPEDVQENGVIVLRSSNIQNSQLDFRDTVRVNCEIRDKFFVHDNDILMCSRNGSAKLVGKVALIRDINEPMSFGAFMMIIRSPYYSYLMTYFQMDSFRRQIRTGATTTINQITGHMLDAVQVPIPDFQKSEQFSSFFAQVEKCKLTVRQGLDKLVAIRKALMQEYFATNIKMGEN